MSTKSNYHETTLHHVEDDLSQKCRPRCNNDWWRPAGGVHQAEHRVVHVRGQVVPTTIGCASAKKEVTKISLIIHSVRIYGFSYYSDFTWNQSKAILKILKALNKMNIDLWYISYQNCRNIKRQKFRASIENCNFGYF